MGEVPSLEIWTAAGFQGDLEKIERNYLVTDIYYIAYKIKDRKLVLDLIYSVGGVGHRLSFLFSSVLSCSIFSLALAFLKFSPVIQTGEHISIRRS